MVGSDENETMNKVKPLLEIMGKNIFMCGASGNG